mgnify:CR=1 FL=1
MSLFAKVDVWHLLNTDTGEQVDGAYPPEDLTHTVGSRWVEKFALNRKNGILQFLHGETDVVTFTATFYKKHLLHSIEGDIELLTRMAVRDRLIARPPILEFWCGDAFLNIKCILEPFTKQIGLPGTDGALKFVTISMTLRKYSPYSLEDTGNFDTRYHRAKAGDYLEFIAWHEYKNPLIGVELAKRHPQVRLAPANNEVIKLPSIEGLRKVRIVPASVAFTTLTERAESSQKTLFKKLLAARGAPKLSTILQG